MTKERRYPKQYEVMMPAYLRAKESRGMNQQMIGDELGGISQGAVGHWLNGSKPIPDDKLLMLSVILGFNPLDVRSDITTYVDLANTVLSSGERGDLIKLVQQLKESEKEQLLNYIHFLFSQRPQ